MGKKDAKAVCLCPFPSYFECIIVDGLVMWQHRPTATRHVSKQSMRVSQNKPLHGLFRNDPKLTTFLSSQAKAAKAAAAKAKKEGKELPKEEVKVKKTTLKERLGFVPRTGPQVTAAPLRRICPRLSGSTPP